MDSIGIRKFRTKILACALLDLVCPCAGRSLIRRAPAGRWGMIWWMGFSLVLAMWTMSMMINALQALAVYLTVWLTVQVNLQSRNVESLLNGAIDEEVGSYERRFSGRRLSIILIVLIYIVTPVVFVTRAANRVTALTVHDFGSFPMVLPDETLLVLKSGSRPARLGELVVWNSEHGTAMGRIVATAGMEVSVRDGALVVNGEPTPSTSPEPVHFKRFRLSDLEQIEAADLMACNEFYGDLTVPTQVFVRSTVRANGATTVVPDGSVYILSDNRTTPTSIDSRNVGPVSTTNIEGQPMFVLWSGGGRPLERITRIGAFPR